MKRIILMVGVLLLACLPFVGTAGCGTGGYYDDYCCWDCWCKMEKVTYLDINTGEEVVIDPTTYDPEDLGPMPAEFEARHLNLIRLMVVWRQ